MTFRIGIVGAGRSGVRKARELSGFPDVQIVGVADPNRPSRDSFSYTFGVRLAVSDHRRLASEPNVDVIYVCSPPATHSTVAVDSLRAGKHVICQQPMAVNAGQADEMIEAARESGRRLLIGLPQRYEAANQMAAQMIDNNEIGFPFMVVASWIENEYDRLNDWHDWKGTWDLGGGGILMERGSEIMDLLHYFLGPVDAVSSICTRFVVQPLNKAEDTCLLDMEFVEEISVQLAMTGAAKYSPWPPGYSARAMRVDIFGEDGGIQITGPEPGLVVSTKSSRHRVVSVSEVNTGMPANMDRDFLDCIRDGGEPLSTPEQAREALRVVLAAYKSSQMKRRVETMEQL